MVVCKPHHCENGDRLWYKDTGSPYQPWHRNHGPAIERSDGSKEWWLMDKQVAVENTPERHSEVLARYFSAISPIYSRFGPRPDNP